VLQIEGPYAQKRQPKHKQQNTQKGKIEKEKQKPGKENCLVKFLEGILHIQFRSPTRHQKLDRPASARVL